MGWCHDNVMTHHHSRTSAYALDPRRAGAAPRAAALGDAAAAQRGDTGALPLTHACERELVWPCGREPPGRLYALHPVDSADVAALLDLMASVLLIPLHKGGRAQPLCNLTGNNKMRVRPGPWQLLGPAAASKACARVCDSDAHQSDRLLAANFDAPHNTTRAGRARGRKQAPAWDRVGNERDSCIERNTHSCALCTAAAYPQTHTHTHTLNTETGVTWHSTTRHVSVCQCGTPGPLAGCYSAGST